MAKQPPVRGGGRAGGGGGAAPRDTQPARPSPDPAIIHDFWLDIQQLQDHPSVSAIGPSMADRDSRIRSLISATGGNSPDFHSGASLSALAVLQSSMPRLESPPCPECGSSSGSPVPDVFWRSGVKIGKSISATTSCDRCGASDGPQFTPAVDTLGRHNLMRQAQAKANLPENQPGAFFMNVPTGDNTPTPLILVEGVGYIGGHFGPASLTHPVSLANAATGNFSPGQAHWSGGGLAGDDPHLRGQLQDVTEFVVMWRDQIAKNCLTRWDKLMPSKDALRVAKKVCKNVNLGDVFTKKVDRAHIYGVAVFRADIMKYNREAEAKGLPKITKQMMELGSQKLSEFFDNFVLANAKDNQVTYKNSGEQLIVHCFDTIKSQ